MANDDDVDRSAIMARRAAFVSAAIAALSCQSQPSAGATATPRRLDVRGLGTTLRVNAFDDPKASVDNPRVDFERAE